MSEPTFIGRVPKRLDFFLRVGCRFGPFRLEITDQAGEPVDIIGWTIDGSLRRSAKSTTAIAAVQSEISDTETGIARFWIEADDIFLPGGESEMDLQSRYWLDIDLITPDSDRLPLIRGYAHLAPRGDLSPPEQNP